MMNTDLAQVVDMMIRLFLASGLPLASELANRLLPELPNMTIES